MKSVARVFAMPDPHWVGDGFPVRSLFSYQGNPQELSPFLMLDYAGPMDFPPTDKARGVEVHPHRGFETVTLVYEGGVSHRDSTGGGGTIGPGDVQWMTAGAGILHEEYHAPEFSRAGGVFRLLQLWVNLPARHKGATPRYQSVTSGQIPVVPFADGKASARIIAGNFQGTKGPAETFSPVNMWDMSLEAGAKVSFEVPEGHTGLVIVVTGAVRPEGSDLLTEARGALFERTGTTMGLEAPEAARILVLTGEPLNEPIVGYGPFVMNSDAEIRTAIEDFRNGRFGAIPAVEHA